MTGAPRKGRKMMGKSNIPPRTMRDVSEQLRRQLGQPLRLAVGVRSTARRGPQPQTGQPAKGKEEFSTGLFRKLRNWRFQTKPLFKKVHGPLVDVFEEAEEVLIVIDLSGFQPGDVFSQLTQEKYFIHARRGSEEFLEEILLSPEVDVEKCVEQFHNGVLEITLPRRRGAQHSEGEP
jgi:HSP20 family molecular chaperone IbpA